MSSLFTVSSAPRLGARALLTLLLPLGVICFVAIAVDVALTRPTLAASQAGFVVNSTADSSDCDTVTCTLRGAIHRANNQAGADTITFDLPASATILLSASLPAISETLTIDGGPVSGLTINGNDAHRIFEVRSGVALSLTQLTLARAGGVARGGALLANSASSVVVSYCRFQANAAFTRGGAIFNDGATIIIDHSEFGENVAVLRGGAIYNDDGSRLALHSSTFLSNSVEFTGEGGGGIYNGAVLSVSTSTFSGNAAEASRGGGAALFNDSLGRATVDASSFLGNQAVAGGGAIRNGGVLTMTSSTLANNTVSAVDGGGGAILNGPDGRLLLANSTVSGNSADNGGGIRNSGLLTLVNVTISRNTAQADMGGGLLNMGMGTLNYSNTIIADSPNGDDCRSEGLIATRIQNLVESGVCGQDIMADPRLAPLQDNGGPTWTQALLPGSPAVDSADAGVCTAPPIDNLDQRGRARPQGSACDLGAFEVVVIAGLQADNSSPTSLGAETTFTATVSAGDAVTFTWSFGDGQGGSGASLNHTYAAAGTYTATVTASNAVSEETAATAVTVVAPEEISYWRYLPLISRP